MFAWSGDVLAGRVPVVVVRMVVMAVALLREVARGLLRAEVAFAASVPPAGTAPRASGEADRDLGRVVLGDAVPPGHLDVSLAGGTRVHPCGYRLPGLCRATMRHGRIADRCPPGGPGAMGRNPRRCLAGGGPRRP